MAHDDNKFFMKASQGARTRLSNASTVETIRAEYFNHWGGAAWIPRRPMSPSGQSQTA